MFGAWLSLVERYLGVVEAVGSNPAAPTNLIVCGALLLLPSEEFGRMRRGIFMFSCEVICVTILIGSAVFRIMPLRAA